MDPVLDVCVREPIMDPVYFALYSLLTTDRRGPERVHRGVQRPSDAVRRHKREWIERG